MFSAPVSVNRLEACGQPQTCSHGLQPSRNIKKLNY
jgi:hypothetical protein